MSVGQDLLNVPFPDMVSSLATAIAKSQYNLDRNSVEILKIMGDKEEAPVYLPNFALKTEGANEFAFDSQGEDNDSVMKTEEIKTSMIGAGFQPTFYQFAETIIEVKMAITMATSTSAQIGVTAKAGFGCFSASVNASYSRKYDYKVEGSSLLRVTLTPVPPPQILQDYMDAFISGISGK